MNKPIVKILSIVLLCLATLVVVFFGMTAARFLWWRPVVVRHNSMQPTLQDGALVYVNTMAKPDFYDIACFFWPTDDAAAQQAPTGDYYSANAFWRSMPIWGTRIAATYRNGYDILVKRVVGLGGDTVELRAETVEGANLVFLYRNGTKVDEPICMLNANAMDEATIAFAQQYAQQYGMDAMDMVSPTAPYTVPEGYCYVLGDNRDGSTDSRVFGPVQMALLVGTVHH